MKLCQTYRYLLHSPNTYYARDFRIYIVPYKPHLSCEQRTSDIDWLERYPLDYEKIDYETVSNI